VMADATANTRDARVTQIHHDNSDLNHE